MLAAQMPADPTDARVVRSVSIVGAGMMGTAIAAANVRCDMPVVLADSDEQVLADAPSRIARELAGDRQVPSPETAGQVGRLVVASTDPARIGACDLVLESIVESLAAKQQLYSRLEPHLSPESLLASNTSTIPIARDRKSVV